MAKFLLGILCGILLCVLSVVILVAVAASLAGRAPSVADGSTLILDLAGDIPERNPTTVPTVLLEGPPRPTLLEIRNLLRKAAADKRINAVVLKPDGMGGGWAKSEEIRLALEEYKKSKKPLLSWMQVAGMRQYYVASSADKVYLAPESLLDVKGLRAELLFFKNTLGKIGVEADLEHMGKYKSYSEHFTESRASEPFREVMNSVLDALLDHFLVTVSRARRMEPQRLRALLDEGPFLSEAAVKAGLADGIQYEDQLFDEVKTVTKVKTIRKLKPQDYNRVSLESLGLAGGSRIALIYAVGDILRGEDDLSPLSGEQSLGADSFCQVLRDVGADHSIKGVIVRIDSPGGDSFASDQIWREMNLLSKKKPMVISMSDAAASGGYYIAMSGDPILAYPGTYTGSIGVVFGKLNLKGLYDKIGLNKEILSRGRNALIDSDYRRFTPEERQRVQRDLRAVYDSFVEKVAEARKRPRDEIDGVSQGRVWLGAQAKQNGLIDEIGGFDRAIAMVKEKAKLRPEDKVTLVAYPPPKKFFEVLMSRLGNVSAERALLSRLRGLAWRPLLTGGMLKISPYSIVVH
jgi:protease-4